MEIRLPKIVAVGIYNSQIAARGKAVSKNRSTKMFEIELPIERGGVSYMDSECTDIEPKFVICAKPGQTRHTKFPFTCYYIHFILNDGALYDALMRLPSFITVGNYGKYLNIFEKLCKYYGTALESDEIMLHSLILELIHSLSDDCVTASSRGGVKQGNYAAIENAVKYIKENLVSNLSLEAVAEYSGFSPVYFHTLFKSATGRTLRDFVEEQRIKRAANMIVSTDSTLTRIAYECGFSSQSYFSYAFKRRMKLTPREYARSVFEKYDAEK